MAQVAGVSLVTCRKVSGNTRRNGRTPPHSDSRFPHFMYRCDPKANAARNVNPARIADAKETPVDNSSA